MTGYLVRKAVFSLLILLVVTFGGFWVLAAHLNPLAPLLFEQPRPTMQIDALTAAAHLDDSIFERYWLWLRGIFGSGLDHTILTREPIWPQVWPAYVRTLELAAGIVVLAVVVGVAVGLLAVRRRGSRTDVAVRALGYLTWSVPVFVVALVLGAAVERAQRATGLHPFLVGGPPSGSGLAYVASAFRHLTLPVVAAALGLAGLYSRYVRAGTLVTLGAPYTTVARAKGLAEGRVVRHHALRTALIPFVAVLTLDLGALLGTTLVVDIVFGVDGLGTLFFDSIRGADPYQLEAVLSVTVLAVVVFSLLGDAVAALLDPRIRIT